MDNTQLEIFVFVAELFALITVIIYSICVSMEFKIKRKHYNKY